ncbi:MAG: hypothetical protein KDE68_13480, partial [Rhodocyclaceae bacterium]|nr:hypothetical protein [Rhodocyclaceae bacterium]
MARALAPAEHSRAQRDPGRRRAALLWALALGLLLATLALWQAARFHLLSVFEADFEADVTELVARAEDRLTRLADSARAAASMARGGDAPSAAGWAGYVDALALARSSPGFSSMALAVFVDGDHGSPAWGDERLVI